MLGTRLQVVLRRRWSITEAMADFYRKAKASMSIK